MLMDSVHRMQQIFDADEASELAADNLRLIREISAHCKAIVDNVHAMVQARKRANILESEREKAIAYHDEVESYFDVIRYHSDKLELIVDNRLWTLPKYRELLYI